MHCTINDKYILPNCQTRTSKGKIQLAVAADYQYEVLYN